MLLLLIPLVVLVMFLIWRRSGRGATRHCRWRLDRSGAVPRHVCSACGAEVRTGSEAPPVFCARK